jgi:hypothetical protein
VVEGQAPRAAAGDTAAGEGRREVNAAAAILVAGALVMPQPWGQLSRRDHVLVMGMPGCGKTPHAAELAAEARRVVYFDPTGEWADLGLRIDAAELDDPATAAAELLRGEFLRVVVEPRDATLCRDFEATVAACRAAAPYGGLVLVVDEVGDLTRECVETLHGLHRNGHKDGVATVFASPCATDFPKRCRDTASRVVSFYQKNADDVATLNREYGREVPNFGDRAAAWRYPSPPVTWVNPTLHD